MKRALHLAVAAIAALVLISASPLTIAGDGPTNLRVADTDVPGGG